MDFLNKNIIRWKPVFVVFLFAVFHAILINAVSAQSGWSISGRVVDVESKIPLAGVTVKADGAKKTAITNKKGEYSINVPEGSEVITFTFVGYKVKTITIKGKLSVLDVELESESSNIDEVVVTGMFERKKESFSGSTKTFSGDELRMVSSQNLIHALRGLDPSLVHVDNNLTGSDPNSLARLELRGKTSVATFNNFGALTDDIAQDPNMPLFILNGFESTLREITDLDLNRIASVTILKDAASTALYGARSANGVVVIETKKPQQGKLNISFNSANNFYIPDFSDYNLMNAAEKLEYERLAGRYSSQSAGREDFVEMEKFYNIRLKAVKSGIDTYWLVEPIRKVAIGNNNSLSAQGGSEDFQYLFGANYNTIGGVMKGSDRKVWGASSDFTYRTNKKLSISNRTVISGIRADNSPYGSFATYARINPYYKKEIVGKYVEEIPSGWNGKTIVKVANPLYNSQLNSEDYSNDFSVSNNLMFNYFVNNSLKIDGGGRVAKATTTSIRFISPLNTMFDKIDVDERGSYGNTKNENNRYSANLGLTYNKVWNKKHVFTGNARGEIQESSSNFVGFSAVGFPTGVNGNPSFAKNYSPNSRPITNFPIKTRRVSVLSSANYNYDNRYFADLTYRMDGSTAFGSSKRFSPFWSAGAGWSLHQEDFIKNLGFFNSLVIRGNIGLTGNQNFESHASTTLYSLENVSNVFGQGMSHYMAGNPNLNWQNTLSSGVALELAMFDRRAIMDVEYYNKKTNDLIIPMVVPLSNGLDNYQTNGGSMTTEGYEANVVYSPIKNISSGINLSLRLTAGAYKSYYGDFDPSVDLINEKLAKNEFLQRFVNGKSPDDLWGYKSLGIDPSSGREIFLDKNDRYVYDFRSANIRVVGNGRPEFYGSFQPNLRIRDFTFNAVVSYSVGGYRFNDALYNKVENISFADLAFNQDKRALEKRWLKPGDLAEFKSISNTDFVPMSSRFIQRDSYISGESISMGYTMRSSNLQWVKSLGVSSLGVNGYMNNIFRLSTILAERGIDYPFARSFSISVNVIF